MRGSPLRLYWSRSPETTSWQLAYAAPVVDTSCSCRQFVTMRRRLFVRLAEEAEADLFGINASGQPDGQALVNLKLVEYRKPDPGAIEEILFFDHPSSRNRILMAMRWKAEHVAEAEAGPRRAAGADRQRGWSPQSAAEWAREREPR